MRAPEGVVQEMSSPSVVQWAGGHDYKTNVAFNCMATSGVCMPAPLSAALYRKDAAYKISIADSMHCNVRWPARTPLCYARSPQAAFALEVCVCCGGGERGRPAAMHLWFQASYVRA